MSRRIPLILLLQLLPALWFCRDFVFEGNLLLSEEVLDMNYAWEKRLDEVGWNLEGALWDRNSFCGVPFLANPATRSLYPPSLFVRLLTPLSPESSFGWLIFIHLWLLGLGGAVWLSGKVHSLAASTLGGWLWSASGYVIVRTGEADPGFLYAVAWIPWILHYLFRLDRPYSVPILSALGFLEVTAGRSDMTFYTAYFAAGLFTWRLFSLGDLGWKRGISRKEVGALLLATIVALLLCAPQILPTLELQKHSSNRSGEADFGFAATDSLFPPQFLLSLIPGCLGDSTETVEPGWVTQRWKFWDRGAGYHEVYSYFGQGTVALALIGLLVGRSKERFYWAGVGVLVSLLAMGRYFPIFQYFFDWAPGWSRFRVPPRVLLGAVPAVAFLAATGLDRFIRDEAPRRRVFAACGGVLVVMSLLCASLMIFSPNFMRSFLLYSGTQKVVDLPPVEEVVVLENAMGVFRGACSWALIWSVLPLGFLLAGANGSLRNRAAGWIIVFIVLVDLCANNGSFIRGEPPDRFSSKFPQDPLIQNHLEEGGDGRLIILGLVLQYERRDAHPWFFPGRLLAYDLEMAQGYVPFLLSDYVQAFEAIAPGEPTHNNGLLLYLFQMQSVVPEVFRWFNVSSLLAPEPLPEIFEKLGEKVYVGKRGFTSKLHLYKNPFRHPRVFLFDAESDSEFPTPNPDLGIAEIAEARSTRLTIRTDVKSAGRLALLETGYPGWICRIDGRETPIGKVARTFRSVAIPEGAHEVIFEYRPETWRRGVLLFWLGFFLWTGTVVRGVRHTIAHRGG